MYRVQKPGMKKEGLPERSLISHLDDLKESKPTSSAHWSGCISKVQVQMT